MGEPANLPSFSKLTDAIARGSGEELREGESEDQFLGRLQHKQTEVHALAATELSSHNPRPTPLHQDLLKFFRDPTYVRVVTTNFDLLFEAAADNLFESRPRVFTAPALPLGSDFDGIVHVHGSLDRENDIVLTDSDFGRAYLIEGWARRFLVDIFRSYTVLFVGYSHNDTVMNYLARALPTETDRFALTPEATVDRWRILGIEPVSYPQASDDDHSCLHDGVKGLANYVSMGILDWQREIAEIARGLPPIDDEASDVLHDALTDPVRVRFFTAAASHVEWIGWLERNHYLDNLFSVRLGHFTERDEILAQWLAETYAHNHAEETFHLLARHGLQMHPDFWFALGRAIGFSKNTLLEPHDLARWVSALLETAPPKPWIGPIKFILPSLGEHCAAAGLTHSLLEIASRLITGHLEIRSSVLPGDDSGQNDESFIFPDVELDLGYHELNEFWRLRLKPILDQVAGALLSIVVNSLDSQHRMLRAWQSADRNFDSVSFGRSAIEPHEQDRYPDATGAVIDIARDCLESLASKNEAEASNWCDRLVRSDVPILRRLALHMLPKREDLTANEKIRWLLSSMGLHDLAAQHETFQVMRTLYPHLNSQTRKAVIDEVLSYMWPITDDEDSEQMAAHHQLSWLQWLQDSDPDCKHANQALQSLQQQVPDFKQQEHPDLPVYTTGPEYYEPQSPWTLSELLSRPPNEWVAELLSFQGEGFFGPSREGLLRVVEEAAIEKFKWGIGLADAFANRGDWDVDLWPPLIRAWSRELDASMHGQALLRLRNVELYTVHARPIADALRVLVKDGGLPYAVQLLAEANELAMALWESLERSELITRERGWLFRAINHPAGVLAEFWLHSLALWQRQQETRPATLGDQYHAALSKIINDTTTIGTLGKTVVASQLGLILASDEEWAKGHLIPLFECEDHDVRQAVWDGFLYGRLDPQVADTMRDSFLSAVSSMTELFSSEGDSRQQFVTSYARMVTYFVDQPLDLWIPKFYHNAEAGDRRRFTWALGSELNRMDDSRQHGWWERWLKQYWGNRLKGIPGTLEANEVEELLGWLPHLDTLFPEAVELAIRMPDGPLERNHVIHEISTSELPSKYPEATAHLLLFVSTMVSPQWMWHGVQEILRELFKSSISDELKTKLQELRAKLGLIEEG